MEYPYNHPLMLNILSYNILKINNKTKLIYLYNVFIKYLPWEI